MQRLKTRLLALCGLVILVAAALAPIAVSAQTCPLIKIQCSSGRTYSCAGTRQGRSCIYDADCLNGGGCSDA
jgi:hypothetical protein